MLRTGAGFDPSFLLDFSECRYKGGDRCGDV